MFSTLIFAFFLFISVPDVLSLRSVPLSNKIFRGMERAPVWSPTNGITSQTQ